MSDTFYRTRSYYKTKQTFN